MKFLKSIRVWWRSMFRKRRFNMLNATDNSEEWHMHLSPASIFAGLVAFVLMLFILTLSLVAYSPVLEFLPGYRTEADRSRAHCRRAGRRVRPQISLFHRRGAAFGAGRKNKSTTKAYPL